MGKGAYTRDCLNKVPAGFRGGRRVLKFNLEVSQILCSGSPESGHTFVVDFLECTEMAFSHISLPEREGKLFCRLPHHRIQCTMGRKRGRIIEDEIG